MSNVAYNERHIVTLKFDSGLRLQYEVGDGEVLIDRLGAVGSQTAIRTAEIPRLIIELEAAQKRLR